MANTPPGPQPLPLRTRRLWQVIDLFFSRRKLPPSIAELARATAVSLPTVKRHLAKLEYAKVIRRTRRAQRNIRLLMSYSTRRAATVAYIPHEAHQKKPPMPEPQPPTPTELAERAAAIRAEWSRDQRLMNLVDPVRAAETDRRDGIEPLLTGCGEEG